MDITSNIKVTFNVKCGSMFCLSLTYSYRYHPSLTLSLNSSKSFNQTNHQADNPLVCRRPVILSISSGLYASHLYLSSESETKIQRRDDSFLHSFNPSHPILVNLFKFKAFSHAHGLQEYSCFYLQCYTDSLFKRRVFIYRLVQASIQSLL